MHDNPIVRFFFEPLTQIQSLESDKVLHFCLIKLDNLLNKSNLFFGLRIKHVLIIKTLKK
jgi:hypothetical protein